MNTIPPRRPPEYRQDPVSGDWVILAPERAYRPIGLGLPSIPSGEADCPFCEGREEQTPPEILAVRPCTLTTPLATPATGANGPGWTIRIVPNGFPAVRTNTWDRGGEAMTLGQPGYGTHDVIIECPEHRDGLSHLSAAHFEALAQAYRDRLKQLAGDPRLASVLLFKNRGALAGASLFHAHSQILALDRVPPLLERELTGCERHFSTTGHCLFCDLMAQESAEGTRILLENDEFVAWCPHASRFPLEAWLVPRRHEAHFHQIDDPESPRSRPDSSTTPRNPRIPSPHPLVQLFFTHLSLPSRAAGRVSLASGDHAPLAGAGWLRDGNRNVHQPRPSRMGRPALARRFKLTNLQKLASGEERCLSGVNWITGSIRPRCVRGGDCGNFCFASYCGHYRRKYRHALLGRGNHREGPMTPAKYSCASFTKQLGPNGQKRER